MSSGRKLRILVGKPGLDGHDRGAKVIARALRDAGFEVIYSGLHQTPEMLVNTAIQESVDCIGLSILSGAHNHLMRDVMKRLAEENAGDIFVFGGGVIPADDAEALEKDGIAAIFTPGTSTTDVVKFLQKKATERGIGGV